MDEDKKSIITEANLRKVLEYIQNGTTDTQTVISVHDVMEAINNAYTERRAAERKRKRQRPSMLSISSLMSPAFLSSLKNTTSATEMNDVNTAEAEMPVRLPESLFADDEEETDEMTVTYRERKLSSLELTRAIRHEIGLKGSKYKATKTMVSSVLYMIYGHWLCLKKEILLDEPPRVMQYGPVFVRAYNKSGTSAPALEYAAHSSLKKNEPQIFGLMRQCVNEYIASGATAYRKRYLGKGSPWETTTRLRQGEWGIKMDDEQNDSWFYTILTYKKSE